MFIHNIKSKLLSDIPGLEEFTDYAIDVDGNVWSHKYKKWNKLRPGWSKKSGTYQFVRLSDNNKNKKNFYVHRLVAMAFIPSDDMSLEVNHKNRNQCDNRLENLEWVDRKTNMEHTTKIKGFILDTFITNKIKEVHSASIRKGLPVPDSYEFMNSLIEGSLEQYINQYGLRKIMYPIPR